MKIGIFAKTFSRPTIEGLFQTIAGYEIYSAQFNLSCAGLETLPGNVVSSELVQRIIGAAEQAKVELSAMSGTFNMAHPDPAVRRDNLTRCTRFSRTDSLVLNVDDAGGDGVPVIFQHGLCGDA
jgi:sugar phosphate isomerase/epimerase